MPAPIIYSTTGSALSSDEISFAYQVAASFSLPMGRGLPKIGRREDQLTGAVVEYHSDKNIAYVTPGGATDYVGVMMPNPVPYRGISLGLVPPGSSDGTLYVVTSDGVVLASETRVRDFDTGYARERYMTAYEDYNNWRDNWSGGPDIWMFEYVSFPPAVTFHHKLTFAVPEDCVEFGGGTQPISPPLSYAGTDGLAAQWAADWAAGVSAFNARRTAWFKKNSDETIAALKTGFSPTAPGVIRAELKTGTLPERWADYIKSAVFSEYTRVSLADGSFAGRHTRMPVVLDVAYVDTVVPDPTVTYHFTRSATFEYIDSNGVTQTAVVVGTWLQTDTTYGAQTISQITYVDWFHDDTGAGDYISTGAGSNVFVGAEWHLSGIGFISKVAPDFVGYNNVPWAGVRNRIAVLYSGAIQTGYISNSAYGVIANPLGIQYPAYSQSITGTAAPLYLQYHNAVLPQYVSDTAQSSTVMNNSAMYGVTEVSISPVGLIANGAGFSAAGTSLGMFSVDEDGTQVEIYGTAVYTFDWSTGSLTFKSWKPLRDVNGNEVAAKTVNLPAGSVWSDSSVNCIITYKGLHWKDVKEYVKLRDADAKSSTFLKSDPIWWALVQAVKAG